MTSSAAQIPRSPTVLNWLGEGPAELNCSVAPQANAIARAYLEERAARLGKHKAHGVDKPLVLATLRAGRPSFVGAGTQQGASMLGELVRLRAFQRLFRVEASSAEFERARAQFAGRNETHLYHGDSGVLLGRMLADAAAMANGEQGAMA